MLCSLYWTRCMLDENPDLLLFIPHIMNATVNLADFWLIQGHHHELSEHRCTWRFRIALRLQTGRKYADPRHLKHGHGSVRGLLVGRLHCTPPGIRFSLMITLNVPQNAHPGNMIGSSIRLISPDCTRHSCITKA